MTYDVDSGLFGDDPFDNNLYDPHLPNPWEVESTDNPDAVTVAGGDIPVGAVVRISYDRGDNEIVSGPDEVDGGHVPRERRGPSRLDQQYVERKRERQATDTGIGNVRGAAGQHTGSDPTGVPGTNGSPAGSFAEAAARLSADTGSADHTPGVADRVEHFIKQTLAGNQPKMERFIRSNSQLPQEFTEATFECTVYKISTNTQGDWLVTIKIPFENRTQAREIDGAFGLAIETTMRRKGLDD